MDVDVVVVGSGGGALTAAVTAADAGLTVLVVEKSDHVGGTTALSGGFVWIPGNPLMAEAGAPDSREAAERYIRHVAGNLYRADLVNAYLDKGPQAIAFLQNKTEVLFQPVGMMDYKPELDGATTGRTIAPRPYDGRRLGAQVGLIRPPLRFMTVFGGMMLDSIDVFHMMNALKSPASFLHSARLSLHYGLDRLRHPRGMRLTYGNALVARLLRSALDRGVEIWTRARAVRLIEGADGVCGVAVCRDDRDMPVHARRGVVLAAGGFAHDPALRARYLPFPDHMQTLTVAGNTGDSLAMAVPVGAAIEDRLFQSFLGVPVSVLHHADGRPEVLMHVASMGRAKPGLVCVGPDGRRFANEAAPYNDLLHSMVTAKAIPAWFVFDHAHFKKFGAGWLRPPVWLHALQPYLDAGYIIRADTIDALAARLGLPAASLAETITRYNANAHAGRDPDFGKGDSPFDRASGDPSHEPSPNVGPVDRPPFYAIRFEPGNLGTFVGLRIDENARVLREDGTAIAGLYACGLDAAPVFSGGYPGGGSSIGPAVVFGFIAGQHIAQIERAL